MSIIVLIPLIINVDIENIIDTHFFYYNIILTDIYNKYFVCYFEDTTNLFDKLFTNYFKIKINNNIYTIPLRKEIYKYNNIKINIIVYFQYKIEKYLLLKTFKKKHITNKIIPKQIIIY